MLGPSHQLADFFQAYRSTDVRLGDHFAYGLCNVIKVHGRTFHRGSQTAHGRAYFSGGRFRGHGTKETTWCWNYGGCSGIDGGRKRQEGCDGTANRPEMGMVNKTWTRSQSLVAARGGRRTHWDVWTHRGCHCPCRSQRCVPRPGVSSRYTVAGSVDDPCLLRIDR